MTRAAIELPSDKIAEFCDCWHVTAFALFGSVLRGDFRIIWNAVQNEIPTLIAELKLRLPPEG